MDNGEDGLSLTILDYHVGLILIVIQKEKNFVFSHP